ncbi:MAG: chromosomal replication initiator protein [Elusimicrobia bacterium]|nr:MAG: chromosomal replication initiator protein [Elusimicrobiota bacterium]KAF0155799.1 MAG: chromosomal replication initiator protein [Elusimicrobiota bacterium]
MDNSINSKELWQNACVKIEQEIGKDPFDLWMRPVSVLVIEGDTVKLEVPDPLIFETIKKRYEEVIIRALSELSGKDYKIDYSLSLAPREPRPAPQPEIQAAPASRPQAAAHSSFNPNYTFQTFIVGPSNRWAYNSAKAVAEKPGHLSNPFFIYSPPGLGKTHLMHAIANEILRLNPAAKVIYTPSENFVNEYIDTIQNKSNSAELFRGKYRKLDCLLLDDIQFLMGKERSEEEFFYTFNALFESKKQIVVTSDRPPRELSLAQRLVSRFLSGTIADMKQPDLETRIAILREKRDQYKFEIPDDVVNFIGENVKTSIRELDGCLLTVGNYCMNMRLQPTIDVVRGIIKDHMGINQDDGDKISIETIISVVAEKYQLDTKDLRSKGRRDSVVVPRQIAMYLACELTELSTTNVGDAFGKDHTTVIYARNKIQNMVHTDLFINELVNTLITKIKSVSNK